MNRPNYKEYLNQCEYETDLEKYCDELEKENKDLKAQILQMSLNLDFYKESSTLYFNLLKKIYKKMFEHQYMDFAEFKERVMKDDQDK